jgi:hypothetical protein
MDENEDVTDHGTSVGGGDSKIEERRAALELLVFEHEELDP